MRSPATRRQLIAGVIFPIVQCQPSAASSRPNILWITCEDLSPVLAVTGTATPTAPTSTVWQPRGVRYERAFSAASVCAPARSSLVTGIQANTLGTMHLRGVVPRARGINCFPAYLRRHTWAEQAGLQFEP